jgi:competence protein ComEC
MTATLKARFLSASAYARPVIPLTLSLIAGIAIGLEWPGGEVAALAVIGGSGAVIARCLACRRPAAFSPLILFVALGYLSLQPCAAPRFPSDHVSRFLDTGPWEITGVVDGRPTEYESRTRFVVTTEHLASDSESHRVSGLLRVTVTGPGAGVAHGDRIVFRSRIRPIRSFNNPGGFDNARHMHLQGVWGSAFTDAGQLVRLAPPAGGLRRFIDAARTAVARRVDAAVCFPEAAVLKALVIGDQAEIPPDVQQAFRRTGTSHILAISGLHLGIVASAAFVVFRWLLGFIRPILLTGWARKGAAPLTLVLVGLYALLAGMSPSTQRALIMAAVFLLTFLVEREHDLMNTLAVAALAILVVSPPSLTSVSFQLSFAAVLMILYGLARAPRREEAAQPVAPGAAARLKRGAALFFRVSFFATVGTLPLVLHYFNTVSFIGLLANCIVVPLMGYVVVLAGLIGACLVPFSDAAASLCFKLGGVVLSASIAAVKQMSDLPFAAAKTVSPSILEMVLFYASAGSFIRLIHARRGPAGRPAPGGAAGAPPQPLRPLRIRHAFRKGGALAAPGMRAAAALLVFCLAAGCADAGYWLYQRFWHRDLRMTLLDVGQGSAALLELPGGRTVLVDGGGAADNSVFDVGAAVVAPFLWRNKIATIDTVILTHPNSDHLNGLIFIAENFNVGALWENGEAWHTLGYQALMRAAAERGIPRPGLAELARGSTINGVRLEVLYPPADFLARRETERFRRDENNNSLVTRFSFEEVSILLPGDIMRPAEKELVDMAGDRLKSRVLVAPHHGSRTSSSEEFVAAVAPQAVLISCADRPGSGIPHAQTLERYAARGARIYRTDRNGAIRIATDGHRLSITAFMDAD